jgi:hypothetical protein
MSDDQSIRGSQGPMRPAVPAGGEYAFDEIQRRFFADAAGTTRLAGFAALAFGVMQLLLIGVFILAGTVTAAIPVAISGFFTLAIGTSVRNAGSSLRGVALRSDGQIASVMSAVGDIRRVFRLQAIVFFLGAAGIVIGIVLAFAAQHRP